MLEDDDSAFLVVVVEDEEEEEGTDNECVAVTHNNNNNNHEDNQNHSFIFFCVGRFYSLLWNLVSDGIEDSCLDSFGGLTLGVTKGFAN